MVMEIEIEEIIDQAAEIISKLHWVQDEIGKLDDNQENYRVRSTPYLDNRMEKGAYQLIREAIRKIEAYTHEVNNEEMKKYD